MTISSSSSSSSSGAVVGRASEHLSLSPRRGWRDEIDMSRAVARVSQNHFTAAAYIHTYMGASRCDVCIGRGGHGKADVA